MPPTSSKDVCLTCQKEAGGLILLKCRDCKKAVHKAHSIAKKADPSKLGDEWRCWNCTKCPVCDKRSQDYNKADPTMSFHKDMVYCKACTQGFHRACLAGESLPAKPSPKNYTWKCSGCKKRKTRTPTKPSPAKKPRTSPSSSSSTVAIPISTSSPSASSSPISRLVEEEEEEASDDDEENNHLDLNEIIGRDEDELFISRNSPEFTAIPIEQEEEEEPRQEQEEQEEQREQDQGQEDAAPEETAPQSSSLSNFIPQMLAMIEESLIRASGFKPLGIGAKDLSSGRREAIVLHQRTYTELLQKIAEAFEIDQASIKSIQLANYSIKNDAGVLMFTRGCEISFFC